MAASSFQFNDEEEEDEEETLKSTNAIRDGLRVSLLGRFKMVSWVNSSFLPIVRVRVKLN